MQNKKQKHRTNLPLETSYSSKNIQSIGQSRKVIAQYKSFVVHPKDFTVLLTGIVFHYDL